MSEDNNKEIATQKDIQILLQELEIDAGVWGKFIEVKSPAGSGDTGTRALVGTPYFLVNPETLALAGERERGIVRAHEMIHLWIGQHIINNQPQIIIDDSQISLPHVVKISSLEGKEFAKRIISYMGFNSYTDPLAILSSLEKRFATRLASWLLRDGENPEAAKAAVCHYLTDQLGRDVESELPVSNDVEEGLVVYLSNYIFSRDKKDWQLHQDREKTAYTLSFAELFPDPKELVGFISRYGYEKFITVYKDLIVTAQKKHLKNLGERNSELNSNQATKLMAALKYDLVEKGYVADITPSELTKTRRADFTRLATFYEQEKTRSAQFDQTSNTLVVEDNAFYLFDEAEQITRNLSSEESYPQRAAAREEFLVWQDSYEKGDYPLIDYLKKLGFASIDDLAKLPSSCIKDIHGTLYPERAIESLNQLQNYESLIVVIDQLPGIIPEIRNTTLHLISVTRTEDEYGAAYRISVAIVFLPQYQQGRENKVSIVKPEVIKPALIDQLFAKIYEFAGQQVRGLCADLQESTDRILSPDEISNLEQEDLQILAVMLFMTGKSGREINRLLQIRQHDQDSFLRNAMLQVRQKILNPEANLQSQDNWHQRQIEHQKMLESTRIREVK